MTPPCRAVARFVEGYLDGELDPSQLIEVEKHTVSCPTCRERVVLDRSIRMGVRRTVSRDKPSPSFRARVGLSLRAQRGWSADRTSRRMSIPAWGGWLVVAAASVIAILGIPPHQKSPVIDDSARFAPEINRASIGLDTMIDQFVDWHARPLPPEITNPNDLPGFEPYVGVPVHPPALSLFGARLLGGRILPVREERTAMLQYTLGSGHRISVYVYDPRRIQVNPSRLRSRVIDNDDPVYIGRVHGWSVAAHEKRGVGYAIASDLDDDESVELVLAASP